MFERNRKSYTASTLSEFSHLIPAKMTGSIYGITEYNYDTQTNYPVILVFGSIRLRNLLLRLLKAIAATH